MAGMQESGIPKTDGKIKGVFSTQKVTTIGTGATTRKTIVQTLYFCTELDDGSIELQPINKNCIPSGKKSSTTKEDLLRRFSPEPEFYVTTVQPRMQEMSVHLEKGDEHRQKSEIYSAEFEYSGAIKLDEENVRANFGIGICYLERGELAKAEDILNRIVKLEAAFEPEHKHLFNEFGIYLRRAGMYDQSIRYYQRALELTKKDDHLYYNIARAHAEKGDVAGAKEHVEMALRLNPRLEAARKLVDQLAGKAPMDAPNSKDANEPKDAGGPRDDKDLRDSKAAKAPTSSNLTFNF